jgi:hypothetical protein
MSKSSCMLKYECKQVLVKRDRRDLLVHVRPEIVDLQASFEPTEEVPELTGEMIVDSLIQKFPEKLVFERKIRVLTLGEKKYAKALNGQ